MAEEDSGWTDEQWAQASNYADQLDIIVKITRKLPYGPAPKAFVLSVPQPEIPRDWAERKVADLAFVGPDGVKPTPGAFTLDSHHQQVSWGASGGAYEIVMWLADSGADIALGMALESLVHKIVNIRKAQFEPSAQPPLEPEQVCSSAKQCVWLTRDRADTSADTMRVVSATSRKNGEWTTTVVAPDGVQYSVSTRQVADGIILSSVEDTTWSEDS